MMEALIHFQLRLLEGNPYENPWLSIAKKAWPDRLVYDLDAQSDDLSIHYAKTFVLEATDLLVTVTLEEELAESAVLLSVLRPLVRRRPATVRIFSEPASPLISRLYQSLRPDEIRSCPMEGWLPPA